MNRPEVLAPVGGREQLLAAVSDEGEMADAFFAAAGDVDAV